MDSGYAEMLHEVDVLEYRINQHYRQAEKELKEKIEKYYKDFDRLDQKKREMVDRGEMTEADYKLWRQNKIAAGKVWEQRKDVISRDLYNVNYKARNMVYDELPDVYASAHNFATYQIENGAHVDTSYVLYNHESVERLIADNPDMIPYQEINRRKDISWNKKNLQSVMIQGILQGESIPHLAKRLSKTVTQKNRAAAIRNARTMATSAYNGGKMDAFKRAKALGIDMKVRWRATFDDRTRDSHRALDGETVEVGQAFSNGLTFPCDMSFLNKLKNGGEKVINFSKGCRETYNCRCTIQGVVKGLESRAYKYRVSAVEGLSYEDWKKGHNAPAIKPKARPQKPIKTPFKPIKAANKTPIVHSELYNKLEGNIQRYGNIASVEVSKLTKKLSQNEIIERISGGDKTGGSCSSLTYAYISNKLGYDVHDYRGGDSREWFASRYNTHQINSLEGVKTYVYEVKTEAYGIPKKLKELDLPINKEYRLACGKHAAIIRNTESGLEYLELQSPYANGWRKFEDGNKTMSDTLISRFRCRKTQETILRKKVMSDFELTEVDSFANVQNDDFIGLMKYLNTEESKQKKGKGGHER